ncbi:hypothetical protein PUW24_25520 [Paenibacillus urinalis]|uniref:Uncharacterized protein n=2 Tax=Paenibacillus TaxID=44249 RepID=A0AAX3MUV9_9BACL|nr:MULTISPECIES: hypothetical protein [Paenibacillus]OMC68838.1 hypothetical protein BK126_13615 [Paenibacillus sp. FSL H7-0326]WDH81396.1 hypothetical protein PUW23_17920 [Paenibacillus urinalis]WDH97445.1 hypothetical protein PUW24_25520 [Paenibacillus urinalis]WDI01112.1 hypothetical protein PUW25_17760 [Paenibacillus urinalis]SDX11707.1 hypothetical protein SAMN05518848_104509 [Paenibacillus sp. PDC88]
MKPIRQRLTKKRGAPKVRLSAARETTGSVPEGDSGNSFKKPEVPIVTLGPSLKGKERPYKVILEKDALYDKPQYMA